MGRVWVSCATESHWSAGYIDKLPTIQMFLLSGLPARGKQV